MELQTVNSTVPATLEANTKSSTFYDLEFNHIIPVFAKDNEVAISHVDFITAVYEAAGQAFQGIRDRPSRD